MKNVFGFESHPSDELLHWQDDRFDRDFKGTIEKLRAAWDLIHNGDPAILAAHNLLMEKAADKARADQADIDAGEDL